MLEQGQGHGDGQWSLDHASCQGGNEEKANNCSDSNIPDFSTPIQQQKVKSACIILPRDWNKEVLLCTYPVVIS